MYDVLCYCHLHYTAVCHILSCCQLHYTAVCDVLCCCHLHYTAVCDVLCCCHLHYTAVCDVLCCCQLHYTEEGLRVSLRRDVRNVRMSSGALQADADVETGGKYSVSAAEILVEEGCLC